MLIMSLTGLWLWWPRGGDFLRGLRWTRSRRFTFNLHLLIGFWISIPLAVVSLTGLYLAFPQSARNAMSTVAPMSPPRGGLGGQIAQHTTLTADRAVDMARKSAPNAEPTALFLPAQQRGEASLNWRVEMKGRDNTFTVTVDDQSGQTRAIAPQSGGSCRSLDPMDP